jgi:hypothetical protein
MGMKTKKEKEKKTEKGAYLSIYREPLGMFVQLIHCVHMNEGARVLKSFAILRS